MYPGGVGIRGKKKKKNSKRERERKPGVIRYTRGEHSESGRRTSVQRADRLHRLLQFKPPLRYVYAPCAEKNEVFGQFCDYLGFGGDQWCGHQ